MNTQEKWDMEIKVRNIGIESCGPFMIDVNFRYDNNPVVGTITVSDLKKE